MGTPPDTDAPARGRGARLPRPGKARDPEGRMPLMEHIRELRNRLIKAVLAVIAGMVVGWLLYKPAFNFITGPYCRITIQGTTGCHGADAHPLVVTGVFDPFFVKLKVAFVVGLIVSSPIWFYQLWAFIAPGLYRREKRWSFAFVGAAVPLFALGGFFAYLAMSRGLRFLLGLTPEGVKPLITIDTYFGYTMAMLLIFGIAFELPLILVMLNMAGVVTHAFIRKYRRVMIFLVFVFAGAATPSPDPFSMLLLAVPCVVLVELAELFVWMNDRRRARREEALLAAEGLSPLDDADSVDADYRT
jgi:sec-independent protein translocase protein TatC